jgi:hypothetical protein
LAWALSQICPAAWRDGWLWVCPHSWRSASGGLVRKRLRSELPRERLENSACRACRCPEQERALAVFQKKVRWWRGSLEFKSTLVECWSRKPIRKAPALGVPQRPTERGREAGIPPHRMRGPHAGTAEERFRRVVREELRKRLFAGRIRLTFPFLAPHSLARGRSWSGSKPAKVDGGVVGWAATDRCGAVLIATAETGVGAELSCPPQALVTCSPPSTSIAPCANVTPRSRTLSYVSAA